jgi:site-specific DNA-methyltransferase (adenine-specific)
MPRPLRTRSEVRVSSSPFVLSTQDAVGWLREQPAESIDLLITDPAYESLEKHRAIGTTTRLKHSKSSSNDWFQIFPNARFGELFRETFRVLKRNTHFYLLCDAETMFVAKPIAEDAGFRFWKPLVWDKRTIGMGYHYRARYEFILFFEKGKRRLNNLGVPDVITVPRVRGGYPAEKPWEVADILIKQSSQPGEVVADPFMGSGSVGVAALKLDRRFLGNDLNPEAVQIAGQRLTAIGPAEAGPHVGPGFLGPRSAEHEDGSRADDVPDAEDSDGGADQLSLLPERR